MNVPHGQEDWSRAELFMLLPAEWKVDEFNDKNWNWPFFWFYNIVDYSAANKTWLGGPFTIISNDEPSKPLAPNTEMSCLMLLASKKIKLEKDEKIQLYQVAPIYSVERDFEKKNGYPKLIRKFDQQDVPFVVDINRNPNC